MMRLRTALGLGLLLTGAGLVGAYYYVGHAGASEPATASGGGAATGAKKIDPDLGASLRPGVTDAAQKFLAAKVTLKFDGKQFETTWETLGLVVDPDAVAREAARLAGAKQQPSADMYVGATRVPVMLDRQKGLEALVGYKDSYDRLPVDAKLDLENRKVIPDVKGYGIYVYASVGVLEAAARAGKNEVELAGGEIEPNVTQEKLGHIDISQVMGSFETTFPPSDKDRNHNLRLAAEKVNGHVIMPGETFSFNAVVGERTEKQGYRVAHVIQAGEMIDGLAGGACQVSSTLHGASFFAGLDIVYSHPHSRPSAYVTMGMDATVVYPSTDLKLKNPYDFPVAIRYVVSLGTMRVEILGKGRPWDKITFEREIKEKKDYETITREEDSWPIGSQVVEQPGFPGYELIRRRIFWKDKKQVKVEKWNIKYPPTTEYLRVGTSADPNATPPEQPKVHTIPDPGDHIFQMSQ
jgi:vancomycin resistance protein YoaR